MKNEFTRIEVYYPIPVKTPLINKKDPLYENVPLIL